MSTFPFGPGDRSTLDVPAWPGPVWPGPFPALRARPCVSVGPFTTEQLLSAAHGAGLLFADKVRDEVKLVLAQEEFR